MNEEVLNTISNLENQSLQDFLMMLYIKGNKGSLKEIDLNKD